jgi:ferredoxin-thioredoxin reductase catalytic subunit
MTPHYKKELQSIADNHGYSVRSEERLDALSDKFLGQVVKYGRMYCPCQNVRNEDSICPCRYMRFYSVCRCGLFTKGEPNGNQKENS